MLQRKYCYKQVSLCLIIRAINKLVDKNVNGNVTNEVGSLADVLSVINAKSKTVAAQVEEVELAA